MKKQTAIAAVVALSIILLIPGAARVQDLGGGGVELPPPSDPAPAKHPKIEAGLFRLVESYKASGLAAAVESARALKIGLNPDDTLRLVVEVEREFLRNPKNRTVWTLTQSIGSLGGQVETTHDDLIQASVPLSAIQRLADSPLVRFVRRPLRPHILATSEGVASTGADEWISLPSFHGTGSKTKVCILDLGFDGYKALLGTELPASVTTRSFRYDNDIEAGEPHGAACAEIVHDMAPDAQLYLVNFDTDVEQHNAVDWIIAQGVQVISYSIGWTNAGAGDGTGPIDIDVDHAAAAGIIWASSAGNDAVSHYEGSFSDPDSDGWHNFSGAAELLKFEVDAYETVGAFLNWDDWGSWNGTDYSGSNQDYDLYLYMWTGVTWLEVASSAGPQTGSQWPTEEIYGYTGTSTTLWGVAIRKVSTTRNCKLELFIWGNNDTIEYNVPSGSLGIPADSKNCLAAGAIDWLDSSYHYYSSRGPTHDGRIKPDFGCPSGVTTDTYGHYGFYGTSASAPHLAGAFGLILSRTAYSSDQILEMLKLRAVDLGSPGKDNMYGWGGLNLKR